MDLLKKKTTPLATKAELTTVENKIPSVNNLVTKTDFNTKVTEVEFKIPDTTNLATKTALNAVENKIPSIINLVKKSKENLKGKLMIIIMMNTLQLKNSMI